MAQDAPSGQTVVPGAQMLALARDRSIPGREAIASSVSEMVANRGSYFKEPEQQLAADILRTLIRDVERFVRSALAVNLAATASAPRDVILALANDDIEVAFPVLSESPPLEDDDLGSVLTEVFTVSVSSDSLYSKRPGWSRQMSRSDMSDLEWAFVKCVLPNKSRGVKRVDDRRLINGIFCTLRVGCPWRDLPSQYGP
jgi:hypothetical protein